VTAPDTRAETARERFAELAASLDGGIDLAEAALWIASEEYPSLDVARQLDRLDDLASTARPGLAGAVHPLERAQRFNTFLFEEQGFEGNLEDYDDPRNSFLNDVLERRTGIPISLAAVYIHVAQRLDLDVRGVCFPGHFLVKWVDPVRDVIVDPFSGEVLSEDLCQERLVAVLGSDTLLRPELHLRPACNREILVRMLTNLKLLYVRAGEYQRALAASERILLLMPGAPTEVRDRGLIYAQLECFGAAVADLERFVSCDPTHPSAAAVRERLEGLRGRTRQLH
jgi:regulator of sirC expression with transglutaminase-like and TPR domain